MCRTETEEQLLLWLHQKIANFGGETSILESNKYEYELAFEPSQRERQPVGPVGGAGAVTPVTDELQRPLRVRGGGDEEARRPNGMEKRCDWLITVMEHMAPTAGGLLNPATSWRAHGIIHAPLPACEILCSESGTPPAYRGKPINTERRCDSTR